MSFGKRSHRLRPIDFVLFSHACEGKSHIGTCQASTYVRFYIAKTGKRNPNWKNEGESKLFFYKIYLNITKHIDKTAKLWYNMYTEGGRPPLQYQKPEVEL